MGTIFTDCQGSPSDSYDWRQLFAVARAWVEGEHPQCQLSEAEMLEAKAERIAIERRVRRELYG
jgi:hypothetical protein